MMRVPEAGRLPQNALAGIPLEGLDDFTREALRIERKRMFRDQAHHLPVAGCCPSPRRSRAFPRAPIIFPCPVKASRPRPSRFGSRVGWRSRTSPACCSRCHRKHWRPARPQTQTIADENALAERLSGRTGAVAVADEDRVAARHPLLLDPDVGGETAANVRDLGVERHHPLDAAVRRTRGSGRTEPAGG